MSGFSRAQFFDFIEINSRVITIVIGKRDVAQPAAARVINPRLQQPLGVRLHTMSLRMHVIIGKETHGATFSRYGAVKNFCRMRRSGYRGKKHRR